MSGERCDVITALTLNTTGKNTAGLVHYHTIIDLHGAATGSCHSPSGDHHRQDLDTIDALELSNSEEYLLIRGQSVLVVFDLAQNRVLKTIGRPSDVPREFLLPRSTALTPLTFTQAHFTADDCVS